MDDLTWETLDSAIDYACPGFSVRRDEVRLPDGTETEFHFVTEPPAVVVLPFTSDDEVVVIEEWRQAVGRISRGLPAGTVEEGDEDLAAAARRELAEETGYEADSVEHLTTKEPANGLFDSVHHYFVARGCVPAGEQQLDFNESIRVGRASFDALLAEALADGHRDGRSSLALYHYALARRQ